MSFIDLPFTVPIMNSAGMLGFDPAPRGADLAHLGAFITNPVSRSPRSAASGRRLAHFPGGVLVHSGLPNPGLRSVVSTYRGKWARSKIPVIVHVIAADPDELFAMVRVLEDVEGVAGLEIGLESAIPADVARAMIQAAVGELPVIARPALEDAARLAGEAADAGASALAIGPPRGELPGPDGAFVAGRIYGPAVRPLAYAALREAVLSGIPVLFTGGIRTGVEIDEALSSGAAGVQLDIALWKTGGFRLPAGSSSARS